MALSILPSGVALYLRTSAARIVTLSLMLGMMWALLILG
jgi:hypothetical protein